MGVGTVSEYLERARRAGVGWPVPGELDDAALEARLFPAAPAGRERALPDLDAIHQELKGVGVTLHLLREEYRQVHGERGYGYSQFCELYRRWAGRLRPSMHHAGEKLFVDFSGKRPSIVNGKTGELVAVELFVGVLGASCYTYAEATATQKLHDWVGAHERMLEYFGGSTAIWAPDQLKDAISEPCRYEPGVNRTYQEMASHYGAVVIPARPRKPRDKAKVETMVLVAQRWILARLRKRSFFDLGELNAAIRELLDELNARLMQKLKVSRRELWERVDRPALEPLPAARYEVSQRARCVRRLAIEPSQEIQADPDAMAAHSRAAEYINAATDGRTVVSVGGVADLKVPTRIDPAYEKCTGPWRLVARVWVTDHETTRAEIVFCSELPSRLALPIAHELGHVFGLRHSPVPADVMFPHYSPGSDHGFSPREVLTMSLLCLRRGGNSWPDNDRAITGGARKERLFVD
jgi:transposase